MYKTPSNAIKEGFLSDIYVDRDSVGFILENAGNNQPAFELLNEISTFLPSSTEIILFGQDGDMPILIPHTGIFPMQSLYEYKGAIVSYSINGLWDAIKAPLCSNIIWYIYNPHELQKYPNETIEQILHDKNIIKVFRCSDYHKMICMMYKIELPPIIIEHFNIKEFTKLVKETKNYECKSSKTINR